MFQEFLTAVNPYLPSVGMFMFAYFMLGLFEELIGIRGIWKWLVAITAGVLFFHFADDVMAKLNAFFLFMGLTPPKPGMYN